MIIDASGRGVWQVTAGSVNRAYDDQLMKYGVALIGPGSSGPWRSDRLGEDFEACSFIRRFASEVRTGDVLLLRTGRSTICAVGLVASDYQYLSQFDDVNGWDLRHARRVRWCPLPEPYDFDAPVFGANPPRLSQVQSADIVEYATQFVQSPPTDWQTRALPELPPEETPLTTEPLELQELVAQARDLWGICLDRGAFGDAPAENESTAHYVAPFLRALGWPVETIAVEWRSIDVCVFSKLPRLPEHCRYVVEVKRLGTGLRGNVLDQAIGYVSALGVQRDVVVTDGIRYRMHEASRNFEPVAYANLARLKQSSLDLFNRMRRP